jgi:hypothetical protein
LPPKTKGNSLGRWLVIAIYSIALSYLVVVGFTSVIPQVFWPARDDSFDVSCSEGLSLLYDELDELRLDYLSSNVVDLETLREELEPWDLRLNALDPRCNADKVQLLRKYRYHVELNLEEYMREDAPLANRVAEMLSSTPEQTPHTPTEPSP